MLISYACNLIFVSISFKFEIYVFKTYGAKNITQKRYRRTQIHQVWHDWLAT